MHQQTSQFPLPYSVDINHTAHTPSPTACVSPPLRAAGRIEGHGTTLWRVASLQARELAALEVIAIYEESSGTQVMNTIRDKFKKSKINCFLNLVFLFRQQALLEGNIRIVRYASMPLTCEIADPWLDLSHRHGGSDWSSSYCWH